MPYRLTLGAARPTIARALNMCQSDARIASYVNEALQRLIPRGKWVGTVQRMRVCARSGCITLPRHVSTVEAFSMCQTPGIIRNEFFEFQGTSYGTLGENDCIGTALINRGLACAFDDFFGTTQRAKVYCDCAEAVGAFITLQGWDENRNWIRTQLADSSWIDGEQVPLSTTPQLSVNYFTSLTGVQKPITNCVVRLYSYDVPSGSNVRALAIYEPDETIPQYRRYLIPGLSSMSSGGSNPLCENDVTCDQKQIELLVKLDFIPVSRDTDYLIIGNLQALKMACMAIQAEENNDLNDAMRLMEGNLIKTNGYPERRGGAISLLEEELANFNGDGPVATPRMQDPCIWGAGYIENFT